LQAFEESETFARCMHKMPAWKDGDALTWFPAS
jgi:hypothetical protein